MDYFNVEKVVSLINNHNWALGEDGFYYYLYQKGSNAMKTKNFSLNPVELRKIKQLTEVALPVVKKDS